MGPPPLRLDYSHNTYLVLSSSSSSSASPPPLRVDSSSDPALSSRLTYAGPLGPGNLANEHIYALQGVSSASAPGAGAERDLVDRAKALLEGLGAGTVQVMAPAMRAKR
ncbi:hypothetical protein DMC30DRAFT_357068 [Rhodotorula diobovata]|uniref:Uncharacterized protein n=1 Tax=Rhodotorula diobovata TaxID=5288 RepID=A0A5C5FMJ1_9BASI|nr:hypothetical protein DMC30DRAFT_357068 [Rhodotorula diobovata]